MAQLSIKNLIVRYGNVVAVDDVSFDVAEGEFISLLGPSGCGKTTTLRCIAGLETASGGEIQIGGDVVARAGYEVPPEKRGINMVFQSYAVWPHMSVFENVAYGLRARNEGKAEIQQQVQEVLRLVGLEAYADRFGTELSGGQQQRVAVARAVVTRPRLLLFDEPLSNLDAGLRERMRFELVELQRRLGKTSIYVTHDQSEAMVMSDRIILMKDGKIIQESSPRELYARPATRFVAEFVGHANLLPARIVSMAGDLAQVRLVNDLLFTAAPSAATPFFAGAEALLCIRPETVELAPSGTEGDNIADARVIRASFLGPIVSCLLDVGGVFIRADMPAQAAPLEGQSVRIRIAPQAITIVPDDPLDPAAPSI